MVSPGLNDPLVPPPLVTQSMVGGVAVTSPTVTALPPDKVGRLSVILRMDNGTLLFVLLELLIVIVRILS